MLDQIDNRKTAVSLIFKLLETIKTDNSPEMKANREKISTVIAAIRDLKTNDPKIIEIEIEKVLGLFEYSKASNELKAALNDIIFSPYYTLGKPKYREVCADQLLNFLKQIPKIPGEDPQLRQAKINEIIYVRNFLLNSKSDDLWAIGAQLNKLIGLFPPPDQPVIIQDLKKRLPAPYRWGEIGHYNNDDKEAKDRQLFILTKQKILMLLTDPKIDTKLDPALKTSLENTKNADDLIIWFEQNKKSLKPQEIKSVNALLNQLPQKVLEDKLGKKGLEALYAGTGEGTEKRQEFFEFYQKRLAALENIPEKQMYDRRKAITDDLIKINLLAKSPNLTDYDRLKLTQYVKNIATNAANTLFAKAEMDAFIQRHTELQGIIKKLSESKEESDKAKLEAAKIEFAALDAIVCPTMEDILGPEGVIKYKAALREEQNSKEFRMALMLNSTKHYEGLLSPTPTNFDILGASSTGKTFATELLVKAKALDYTKTEVCKVLVAQNIKDQINQAKDIQAIKDILTKLPANSKIDEILDRINQGFDVASCDGGLERELSQVRCTMLRGALGQGRIGIEDLTKSTAIKSVKEGRGGATKFRVMDAALASETDMSLAFPSTKTNPLEKKPGATKERKTVVAFIDADKEQTKISGENRAFAKKAELTSSEDLAFNGKIPVESKIYDPKHFDRGYTQSLMAFIKAMNTSGVECYHLDNMVVHLRYNPNPDPKDKSGNNFFGWEIATPENRTYTVKVNASDFNNWLKEVREQQIKHQKDPQEFSKWLNANNFDSWRSKNQRGIVISDQNHIPDDFQAKMERVAAGKAVDFRQSKYEFLSKAPTPSPSTSPASSPASLSASSPASLSASSPALSASSLASSPAVSPDSLPAASDHHEVLSLYNLNSHSSSLKELVHEAAHDAAQSHPDLSANEELLKNLKELRNLSPILRLTHMLLLIDQTITHFENKGDLTDEIRVKVQKICDLAPKPSSQISDQKSKQSINNLQSVMVLTNNLNSILESHPTHKLR